MRILGITLVFAALFAVTANAQDFDAKLLKVGEKAPVVKLPMADGKNFDMAAFAKDKKAKAIILNFWFST